MFWAVVKWLTFLLNSRLGPVLNEPESEIKEEKHYICIQVYNIIY